MPENVNTFNGLQISGNIDKFTISNEAFKKAESLTLSSYS